MSKLEETNKLITKVTEYEKSGVQMREFVFIADIAKSLAIIADELQEINRKKRYEDR